jgi:hypothetical protein
MINYNEEKKSIEIEEIRIYLQEIIQTRVEMTTKLK